MGINLRSLAAPLALSLVSIIAHSALAQPITAVLRLKEKVSLETLAQNVRDPASSRYAHFYGPDEIRALSAPSQDDYASLLAQLKEEGFTVVGESNTHLWVSVQAEPEIFEQVFGTRIRSIDQKFHQNLYRAQASVRLPLIEAVVGLDNTRRAHPLYHRAAQLTKSPGGIAQSRIKSAYGFDPVYKQGWTGKGQHIAIATYDGFSVSDVQYFYRYSKLNPMPTVDTVNFNGKAKYDEGSATETELDAEFAGMIAPGANIHIFTSAANSDAGELQMFTAILDDNRAKVVNYSWGSCEKGLNDDHKNEMNKVFARAVAQGVNIMVASGDSGSDACGDGTTVADWPASHPDVVAVGGTTFRQDGKGQLSERAWSGSGGGISGIFDRPLWQQLLSGVFAKRSFPDVAFNADPQTGQAIWTHDKGQTGWMVVGGTSMAAPQWSGFLALLGQARAANKKSPIGFLNPKIYALNSASKNAAFHDVTSGSNGAYSAGPGWDAVTGLGSMQADALLGTLYNQ
jgi:kumamolisin